MTKAKGNVESLISFFFHALADGFYTRNLYACVGPEKNIFQNSGSWCNTSEIRQSGSMSP